MLSKGTYNNIIITCLRTSKTCNNTSRVAVALLTGWVVVVLLLAFITFSAVEVRFAVALTVVVTRRSDGTGYITIASCNNKETNGKNLLKRC